MVRYSLRLDPEDLRWYALVIALFALILVGRSL